MFRSYRLCFLGRNNFNTPLVSQRTSFLPTKQLAREYSEPQIETQHHFQKSKNIRNEAVKTASNLKYILFKDILKGESTRYLDSQKKELFLKDFFQNIMHYPPNEIIKALKMLTSSNIRPFSAIKTLCDILVTKSDHKFTEWECSDLLYSLSKLQYRHEPSIQLIIKSLKNNPKSFDNIKIINSVMHSLTLLKIRDCKLFESMFKSVLKHPFDIKTHLSALMAMCTLNFSSSHADALIKPFLKFEETDFYQTKDYITFIWACMLLEKQNQISEEHFKNVLSVNFIEKLENVANKFHIGLKLKLLNINAAASLMPSYKGPFLHTLPQYKYFYPQTTNVKNNFLESVTDTIIYIVSKNALLRSTVDTGTGVYLDVECQLKSEDVAEMLSKKGQPVKLGIMLQNYNDICNDGTMTGMFAFRLKVAKAQGYKVVVLKHSEYPINSKLSEKIVFLRKKIQDAIESKEETKSKN